MSEEILGDEVAGAAPPATEEGLVLLDNSGKQSTVQDVNTETWIGVYKNFSSYNINIAIEDTYTGGGGFLGNVDQKNAYSYIVPKLTENFYLTRVALNQYINFYAPHIDAKVDPVIAAGVRDYVMSGDTIIEEDPWLDFAEDATGTDISLNQIRDVAAKEAWRHDVTYLVMDKVDDDDGGRRTICYKKSAVDVDEYERNPRNMRLESITFWEQSIRTDDNQIIYVKYKWIAGYLIELRSKPQHPNSDREKAEYEQHSETPTGIDKLNIYPMFAEPGNIGDYKPTMPGSFKVARVCCMLYNLQNWLNYLLFKQGHGLYVFQGEIDGLRDALSNIVNIPPDTEERKFKMPQILAPEADLIEAHRSNINDIIAIMTSVMGTDGVNVVTKSNTAESGASKAFDFIGTNEVLQKTVRMLKRADVWIKEMYNLFEGRTLDYDYMTEYPDEFFPDTGLNALEMIDIAEEIENRGMETVAKEMFRNIIATVLKDLPPEKLSEVLKDVESYSIQDDTKVTGETDEEETEEE